MGVKALLADDDTELLVPLSEALTELGMEVQCAASGAELIQRLVGSSYDIVITDVSMPWMNGLHAALAARNSGLKMPIVVMTGLRNEKVLSQMAALGANVVLVRKPFKFTDLVAAISSLLGPGALQPRADSKPE